MKKEAPAPPAEKAPAPKKEAYYVPRRRFSLLSLLEL